MRDSRDHSGGSHLSLALIDIWKWELDHFNHLPLGAWRVVRQFLEEKPLIRSKCPEAELWGTVAGFDHPWVADFGNVRVVLVPGNGVRAWTVTCFTPMELSNWHRDLSTTKPFPTLIHNKRDPIRTA